MNPPSIGKSHLIIPVGVSGAGKTFFAEHFAETFNAPLISTEKIKEGMFNKTNVSEKQNLVADKIALQLLDEVMKTGQTIVYSGETGNRTIRALLKKRAAAKGYEPILIWVQTDQFTARKRATKSLPGLDYDKLLRKFEPPTRTDKIVVISGQHTFISQLKIILKFLTSNNLPTPGPQTNRVR